MAIVHYTEASGGLPNAGRLSGTDGDLVGILDVVLVAAGWAIQFSSGTDRVYRAATGNRFVLTVRDAAAISGAANYATVRGAESASSASSYTDTFPLTAQFSDANANWIKSSTVNTTARNFDIYASATWILYIVNYSGTTNIWDAMFFGDIPAAYSGDSYNTVHMTRINQTPGIGCLANAIAGASNTSNRALWARSFDAANKSTCGGLVQSAFAASWTSTGFPPAKAGPSSGIDMQKMQVSDSGQASNGTPSTTKGLPVRGYMPNIWFPLHGGFGTVNSRDTWTDTAYNGSATFKAFVFAASTTWFIVEETDTWSPPGT